MTAPADSGIRCPGSYWSEPLSVKYIARVYKAVIKPFFHLLILASLAIGQTSVAADLADMLERAMVSDPLLREADANRLAASESKPQALGALLPAIDAAANWTDTTNEGERNTTFGSSTFPTIFDNESDGWDWNVQLRQTLFRWDQWVALKQADKQLAQAEIDFRAAQQDLISRVTENYFNVLAAQDTLASEQAAKTAIGRQLEQAQKRFEVGLIAITDVQEAQAAYDDAVAAEILAKRALANQHEVLREITGEYTTDIAGPNQEIPLLSPQPADENQWVEVALQQNPQLLSAELAAEIARQDVSIARSSHLPTVDLVLRYSETDNSGVGVNTGPDFATLGQPGGPDITTRISPLANDSNDTSIGVQFALPLFSGGATASRVKQAKYRHRASKEALERVARSTERETRDAYLGVISEISRVKALQQALASARTALQATEAGFEVGTRTTVDVLDGRRALLLAETNYARSRYDYIVNVLALKKAAGTLSFEDVAEVNSWLNEES